MSWTAQHMAAATVCAQDTPAAKEQKTPAAKEQKRKPTEPTHTDTPRNRGSGLAFAIGLGYEYGLVGGQLLYFYRPGELPLFVTPHAGIGFFGDFSYCVGLSTAWGTRHRAVLDASWGAVGFAKLNLHGVIVDERASYGLHGALGYEYTGDKGFIVRALGGAAYQIDARLGESEKGVLFTFSLGIGLKLW
jgi:hypothetical protein